MVLNAGSLGRRIQIQRYTKTGRNEFGNSVGEWGQFGPAIFAQRRDVSDEERLLAGRWDNVLVTRFIIRATSFGRSITRFDRLEHVFQRSISIASAQCCSMERRLSPL